MVFVILRRLVLRSSSIATAEGGSRRISVFGEFRLTAAGLFDTAIMKQAELLLIAVVIKLM